MSKIIGVQKSVGEYEGYPYSNYRIFCVESFNPNAKDVLGNWCKTYTAKTEIVDRWMAEKKLSLQNLIGMNVEMFFDDHGKVSLIQQA